MPETELSTKPDYSSSTLSVDSFTDDHDTSPLVVDFVTNEPHGVLPVEEAVVQRRSICDKLKPYWHEFVVPMVPRRGITEKTHG